jgi:polyisoprenoid-binding protein YceI
MKASYELDPAHSSAQFTVRHMMITNVRGGFSNVKGKLVYDLDDPTSSTIEAVIDTSTINTLDAQRDGHLKSADFLDVEHFPAITFRSTKIQPSGEGELSVTGDLTIHGVTRQVVLKVEGPSGEGKDPWGNMRIGASGSTKIKRSDFGLTWNAALETGGFLVGDDVKIDLELQAIKAAASAA